MDLKEITTGFRSAFWLDELTYLKQFSSTYTPTDSERKTILKALYDALANHRRGRAVNWAVLGIVLCAEDLLANVRRQGMFRPSKYWFSPATASFVLAALHDRETSLGLSAKVAAYLHSMSLLHKVSTRIEHDLHTVCAELRERRESALRGVLAMVDFYFMVNHESDRFAPTTQVNYYSQEELAEGFSFLIHLYHEHVGRPIENLPLEAAKAVHGDYNETLIKAVKARTFQEWEILVDVLDYQVTSIDNERTLRLSPPTQELEKAYRLGFVSVESARQVMLRAGQTEEGPTVEDVGKLVYERFGDNLVEYVAQPLPRFRYNVPLGGPLTVVLGQEEFFRDEALALRNACKEMMVSLPELLAFKVGDGVTVSDLLKVQRLFSIYRWCITPHLMSLISTDSGIVFQSLVPFMTYTDLHQLMSCAVTPEKAQAVAEFLTWKPGTGRICDSQYQPFISLKRGAWVPMSLLSKCDFVHNSLSLSRRRIYSGSDPDPLARLLSDAFKAHSLPVAEGVKYQYQGTSGDMDCVALCDDRLFIFECKNSLLPCSAQEIRTSYDHVLKAASQLSRLQDLYAQDDFKAYLSARLHWPISSTTQLITCIVVGNRMFNGYRIGGHAIRASYELASFVAAGTIALNNEVRCFWAGDRFSGNDLEKYIVADLIHKPVLESMEAFTETYVCGDMSLQVETFVLNGIDMAAKLGFSVERLITSIQSVQARSSQPNPPDGG